MGSCYNPRIKSASFNSHSPFLRKICPDQDEEQKERFQIQRIACTVRTIRRGSLRPGRESCDSPRQIVIVPWWKGESRAQKRHRAL